MPAAPFLCLLARPQLKKLEKKLFHTSFRVWPGSDNPAGTHNQKRIIKMSKLITTVLLLFTACVGWTQSVLAQQAQDKAVPVEFFACNYEDGKGLADLKKVGKKFSAWADKEDSKYSAWILTPQFHNDLDFEVAWMGAWPDGAAFGKSQDGWMSGGKDMANEFAKVIDCSQEHQLVTSAVVNAPKGPPGDGVVMFSACTMVPGVSPVDALPAHRKAAALMKDMGSKGMSWLFFPGLGSGDIDFTYWRVMAFQNYSDMGAAMELYFNGGGWQKVMGILGGVSTCNTGSAFDAHVVRQATGS